MPVLTTQVFNSMHCVVTCCLPMTYEVTSDYRTCSSSASSTMDINGKISLYRIINGVENGAHQLSRGSMPGSDGRTATCDLNVMRGGYLGQTLLIRYDQLTFLVNLILQREVDDVPNATQ